MSIKSNAFSGLIWTLIDTLVLKGAYFFATLIIARILGPSEFGLIGMTAIFVSLGALFIDGGLSVSLVRAEVVTQKDFSTVFFANIFVTILVIIIIYYTAPVAANFYNEQVLIYMIRTYSLGFLFSAFMATQISYLRRHLEFKRIVICSIPGTIAGILSGLLMAIEGYGVWSLVWMHIINQMINALCFLIFSGWSPNFSFSWAILLRHYNFGYKLLLSGILNITFNNLYNIVIGRFFSVKTLGYYERANNLNEYPVIVISGIIDKVTFPIMSKIQDQKDRVARVYRELIQLSFFISAPLMFGACALAEPLFAVVLGTKWLAAVPIFQILCFASALYPIHALNIVILKVYGRSDLFLKLEIIKKTIMLIGVFITIKLGIYILVSSVVLYSVLALYVNTMYSKDVISYGFKEQVLDMLPIFLVSSLMALIMFVLTIMLETHGLYVQLLIPSLVGCVAFTSIAVYIRLNSFKFVYQLVKERFA